jgi:hypothetical protein
MAVTNCAPVSAKAVAGAKKNAAKRATIAAHVFKFARKFFILQLFLKASPPTPLQRRGGKFGTFLMIFDF